MNSMFCGCTSLIKLNISNFNIEKVINMINMLLLVYHWKNLINFSNFNTNNVIYMKWMFSRCSSFEKLNFSDFNMSKTTYMTNWYIWYVFFVSTILINIIKEQIDNISKQTFFN